MFKGHGDSVDQLTWHPTKPDLLVTASGDKTVRVWDARASKAVTTINKGENINIAWSPDGSTIAVGNKKDLLTFIDTKTFKVRAEKQFQFEVNEISWNQSNDLFFQVRQILRHRLRSSTMSSSSQHRSETITCLLCHYYIIKDNTEVLHPAFQQSVAACIPSPRCVESLINIIK